jgi:hypothetical protein
MEQNPTRKSRLSSGQFAQRTVIELKRSRWHARLITLMHVCTGIVVAMSAFPGQILFFLELIVLASLVIALHRSRRKTGVISLRRSGELWFRPSYDSSWSRVEVDWAFASGWLIVLGLSGNHAARPVRLVCFPDSVQQGDFRRLAIFTRLHGPSSAKHAG